MPCIRGVEARVQRVLEHPYKFTYACIITPKITWLYYDAWNYNYDFDAASCDTYTVKHNESDAIIITDSN